jgi:hypothetical protein
VLEGLDLFDRLVFIDFRNLDVARVAEMRGISLTAADVEHAMHVVRPGRAAAGFDAVRLISTRLPLLWPAAPLLYLPGVALPGRVLYGALARRRMGLVSCSAAGCSLAPEAPPAASGDRPHVLRGPALVGAIIIVLSGAWAMRSEFYPLSSWQMFSSSNHSGIIWYYHVFKTTEDGAQSEARLENMGLGVARYRPMLANAFADPSGRGRKRCIDLLRHCGQAWNSRAGPGQRVVLLRAVKFEWDFVRNPDDPQFGQPAADIEVAIDPAGGAAPSAAARAAPAAARR